MTALLALVLAAGPGFLEPVDLRVRINEESDAQVLVDLCKLPAAHVELRTRSNMLGTEDVDALRRCRAPLVQLRAPVLTVHRERLDKVPRAEPLFELSEAQTLEWTAASALGPRRVHVRLGGALTDARAAQLAKFRDAEVELDLRGRTPDAEELGRFRGLARVDRVVRLGASAPPELVAALRALKLGEIVVEARDNQLPAPLLAALAESGVRTRVALSWPFVARDLEPLTRLPNLALELELGTQELMPRGLKAALAPVEPDASKPSGAAAPGPELPR